MNPPFSNQDMPAQTLSTKARVFLVSHGFQTSYERGFVNGLAATRLDATLISSDRTDYAGLMASAKTCNLRGSQEEDRPKLTKLRNMIDYHLALCRLVWRNREAVVHVIGLLHPPILCGIVEGAVFRYFARSYVLTVHDLLPHDRHTRLNRWIAKMSFHLPNQLVVHTRKMREQLVNDYGVSTGRITVMEHGIEPLPARDSLERPAAAKVPNRPTRLLFFGLVAPYKGLDILLEAIDGMSGAVELHIMGRAKSAAVATEIRSLIDANSHRSDIVWRNEYLPENELADIFAACDVLVLPYRWIDQSGVLFQALRFGLPVIASRVGAFEDYVSSDTGLLFDPGDVIQLRHCIERFTADKLAYDRTAIERYGRTFEWSRTVRALEPVYAAHGSPSI